MESEFTNWLKSEMESRKMNQVELARFSGLSQGAISKVINKNYQPGPNFCKGIAKAFGIPKEVVMIKANIISENIDDEKVIDQVMLEINQKIAFLPEEKRRQMLEFIDAVYQKEVKEQNKKLSGRLSVNDISKY
jgi:transcriptional regulator with XRE-family HTH domain